MSENRRYYWYKMKTDFFDEMIIKFLRLQTDGNKLVLLFQKVMLYSLKNDGYLTYKEMLPTLGDELALAINEKSEPMKKLLDILFTYGAIEETEKNTFYIKFLEDCIGSETRDAVRMRTKKKNSENNISSDSEISSSENENISQESEKISSDSKNITQISENFPPEIEKEKRRDRERYRDREEKNASAFSIQKESGSVNVQNAKIPTESTVQEHNSVARKNPPRNYELESFLEKNNLRYEDFMPGFVKH